VDKLGTFSFAKAKKNSRKHRKWRAGAEKRTQTQKNVRVAHKEELLKVINSIATWQVDF